LSKDNTCKTTASCDIDYAVFLLFSKYHLDNCHIEKAVNKFYTRVYKSDTSVILTYTSRL